MDKFISLSAYTKVVENGGFAAAAREMGLSRSAVSKYVMALENELDTQLLHRSTRQLNPTEMGLIFYDRAVAILDAMHEAEAAVTQLQESPKGNLKVNAPMSFGISHISPIIADFMATYEDVHVELVLNDRFIDPIEEGFDVTIRISEPGVSTSLIIREILPVHRLLCASPAYLNKHGVPVHTKELINHRCLNYGYLGSRNQWKLTGQDGEAPVQINCVMWSNNGDSLRELALRDQGIVLLPDFLVEKDIEDGALNIILEDYCPAPISICAVYPRHRNISVKTKLFVDKLSEVLAKKSASGEAL